MFSYMEFQIRHQATQLANSGSTIYWHGVIGQILLSREYVHFVICFDIETSQHSTLCIIYCNQVSKIWHFYLFIFILVNGKITLLNISFYLQQVTQSNTYRLILKCCQKCCWFGATLLHSHLLSINNVIQARNYTWQAIVL